MVRRLRYILFQETRELHEAGSVDSAFKNPSKSVLCRGPESNWRHMVLQVMFLAVCEFAPERKHDDTWL
jgi:hypothetical protein